MQYKLTKSKYCKGIQCYKILWLDENHPEFSEDTVSQSLLDTGKKVGELARSYFGKYDLVPFNYDVKVMVDNTAKLMNSADIIAEASFNFDYMFCTVDILHKNGDGWDIVEVKSSTEISDIHLEDIAFQYYVVKMCKVHIKNVYILHINNNYVRGEKQDLKGLFMLEDCTDFAIKKFDIIKNDGRLDAMKLYAVNKVEPVKDIDVCCEKPYQCAYKKYCGKHIPEYSIFNLARMHTKKKYELYHMGIVSYHDIMKNLDKINDNQKKQVESVFFDKKDEYNPNEIKNFLEALSYPIYHLDFETFQQAVPEFIGCRPYEQIPFQYSLHVEYEDGRLEHFEYLAKEGEDPRRSLAEHLIIDIPMGVCSMAYNMSFEKSVIRNLAKTFPDLSKQLMDIHDNMHDLMIPFQKQFYYSKAMNGSYSIKYVLPALWPGDPELDYHNLDGVHNGAEALALYADMVNHTPEEIKEMRENLLKYCWLDTYAMVKVLKKLREIIKE